MGNIIRFDCLSGLRPAEAIEAVWLIKDKDALQKYYKPERNALEHFRFPEVFFRQTKKATFCGLDAIQHTAFQSL